MKPVTPLKIPGMPSQCPSCGDEKVWKYGSRLTRKGERRRFLCRKCGYLWEVSDEKQEQASSSDKLNSYFLELMKQTIDDLENGIPLEKAGWTAFNPQLIKELVGTGLCQRENDRARLIPSKPLPSKLSQTHEYNILSDIKNAICINELLSGISENVELFLGAKYAGLIVMLQNSEFPILDSLLYKEGLNQDDWFCKVPNSAHDLAFGLAKKWEAVERLEKSLSALYNFGTPMPKMENGEDSDKIKKILKWDKVSEVLDSEILGALGFLWYVDFLMVQNNIVYPESVKIVQDNALDVLYVKSGMRIEGLERGLLDAISRIESETNETVVNEIGKKERNNITDWRYIVRLPEW